MDNFNIEEERSRVNAGGGENCPAIRRDVIEGHVGKKRHFFQHSSSIVSIVMPM